MCPKDCPSCVGHLGQPPDDDGLWQNVVTVLAHRLNHWPAMIQLFAK